MEISEKQPDGTGDIIVTELNNRFRVIETAKTFGAQFSHRSQKSNESVEEFSAELKSPAQKTLY